MSKEAEKEVDVQKTAKDLADLIFKFISFSELEKLVHNLFNTNEMYELINFLSKVILNHFFPTKKDVKTNGKKRK